MLGSEEKTINGAAYTTNRFPARRAVKIGMKLVRLIGPSLGAMAGGVVIKGNKIKEIKTDLLPQAIKALVSQLDEDQALDLILEILSQTSRVNPSTKKREEVNKPEVFDEVYAGNLGELLGALKFALEVSLSSFFSQLGISGLLDRARKMAGNLMSQDGSPPE